MFYEKYVFTVMVNKSSNTNKENNHLIPQTTKPQKNHDTRHRNPGPGLAQAQKCGRVKPVFMRSKLDN